MRVAVTGTPGTGKTSAVAVLEERSTETAGDGATLPASLDVVHLNDLIEPEGLYTERDEERDSLVVDLDAVREYFEGREDVLVESHLAHHLDVDRVVVLRCHPEEVERRLRERGEADPGAAENEASVRENAESEALDVVLAEAVDRHGIEAVYEVETTHRTPEAVADEIAGVVDGDREPSAGTVDYTGYL